MSVYGLDLTYIEVFEFPVFSQLHIWMLYMVLKH